MAIVAQGSTWPTLSFHRQMNMKNWRVQPKPESRPDIAFDPNALGFRIGNYGLTTFGDLFTDRQLTALNTFSKLVHEARERIENDALMAGFCDDLGPLRDRGHGGKAYAEAVSVYLAFAITAVLTKR